MVFRKRTLASRAAVLLLVVGCIHADEKAWIVKDGVPQAQIVIDDSPPRMVGIAARELQLYVAKITAAELPIVTEPTDGLPLKVFVGRSDHTDRLGITDEGLKHGAYRMVSGPDWLALVGLVAARIHPMHCRRPESTGLVQTL